MLTLLLCVLHIVASADQLGYIDRTTQLLLNSSFGQHVASRTHHCDIQRSSLTRMAADASFFGPLAQLWNSHLGTLNISYPATCPLLETHDAYHDYHDKRGEFNHQGSRCCYCGKAFDSLQSLDKHLLRRHADKLAIESTGCLADWCDVLQCHAMDYEFRNHYLSLPCFPRKMMSLQAQCTQVLTACLPVVPGVFAGNVTALELDMASIVTEACSYLSCERVDMLRRWQWLSWGSLLKVSAILAVTVAFVLFVVYLCSCVGELRRRWAAAAHRPSMQRLFNRLPDYFREVGTRPIITLIARCIVWMLLFTTLYRAFLFTPRPHITFPHITHPHITGLGRAHSQAGAAASCEGILISRPTASATALLPVP